MFTAPNVVWSLVHMGLCWHDQREKIVIKSVYQIIKLTQLGTAVLNLYVAPKKKFNIKRDQKSAMP